MGAKAAVFAIVLACGAAACGSDDGGSSNGSGGKGGAPSGGAGGASAAGGTSAGGSSGSSGGSGGSAASPDGGGSDAGSATTACGTPTQKPPNAAPNPVTGKALVGLELFDGWTDPRQVPPPVSTTGWEDSAYISADGKTLYYGYTEWSFAALEKGQIVIDGPKRAGQKGPSFDIWEAHVENGAWVSLNSSANSPGDIPEAAIGVDAAESMLAFVRFDGKGDIYVACRAGDGWQNPATKLPAPINTACVEDNPHLSSDGRTLFFDSSRADTTGTSCKADDPSARTFYWTTWANGAWSEPKALLGTPNGPAFHWQIFTDTNDEHVYWSGGEADCAGRAACFYQSTRQPDGSYLGAKLIARPVELGQMKAGDVFALGEMSITADNRFLYFVYIELGPNGERDLSLGVARR